jgi:N-methylhydantoinase B
VDALADAEPLRAGTVVRVRTTGGGGWGDPLERPVDEVLRDIAWRKVSIEGAERDYGVVVDAGGGADVAATEALRARRRAERPGTQPFFDRGPGYATLSGGATSNEYDLL